MLEQFRIEHGPAGVARLVGRCLELEPDPAEVRVVLETRHGLLVEALLDAGFTVVPVNPDLVARRRGPARKKDDAEDARICCLLALDRHASLKRLVPTRRARRGAAGDRPRRRTRRPGPAAAAEPAAGGSAEHLPGRAHAGRCRSGRADGAAAAGTLAHPGRARRRRSRRTGRFRPRRPARLARPVRRPRHHRARCADAADPRLPHPRQSRRDQTGRRPAAGPAPGPPRLGTPHGRDPARRPTHRPRPHPQGPPTHRMPSQAGRST